MTLPGPHLSPDDFDAWMSGTLAPDTREHLDHCPECRERAEAEREIVGLLSSLSLMDPAPGFADRVMLSVSLPDPFSLRSLAVSSADCLPRRGPRPSRQRSRWCWSAR